MFQVIRELFQNPPSDAELPVFLPDHQIEHVSIADAVGKRAHEPDQTAVMESGGNGKRALEHGGNRFRVGMVFQYSEYQLFEETVRADIAFGPKNMKLDKDEIERRVLDAARFVGIPEDMLDRSPFDLSGGQKRRVAIAGVIAMRPDILILDEPAAGLDPRGRNEILSRISEYKKETGSTVVMISHSMEDMAKYCDKILVMNRGKAFLYGTPSEIFSNAHLVKSVGLGVPQVTRLMQKLRDMGYDLSPSVYTVEDAAKEIIRALGGGGNAS